MSTHVLTIVVVVAVVLAGCGSSQVAHDAAVIAAPTDAPASPKPDPEPPTPEAQKPSAPPPPPTMTAPLSLVAVTFNTGMHDQDPNDDFSGNTGRIVEDYYGAGLSWNKAIADTKVWFAGVDADVIGLQEIFDPEECPTIPADKKQGFVCETWKVGDPTVAQTILGPGYQVACHPGHHDNCIGVKLSFGKLKGCAGASCPDGLTGAPIPTCGKGARVGRGVIELVAGGELTVVSIHGTSGSELHDGECRTKQFEQIFKNLDGAPGANGKRNLIVGDFNTDPGRLTKVDASAKTLDELVGTGTSSFHFVTDVGSNATPTYQQALVPLLPVGFNIDHVISDVLKGTCWTAGVTVGHPPVASTNYFDHKPAVCSVSE